MLISISTRDCGVAIGKAIEANKARVATDIDRLKEEAYTALRTGAEHNGMKVDDARDKEMREMIDRDAEHMTGQHPGQQTLKVLELLERMVKRNDDTHYVTIDDADFNMLEEHLPLREEPMSERDRADLK